MQSNLSRLPYNAGILIFLLTDSRRMAAQSTNPWPTIGAIPLPAGYHRVPGQDAAAAYSPEAIGV
ncbi:hypothetical protein ACQ86N_20740 [Puia sp. P3]|uniref:hypothetical protein n=1 Tax=Puia sp. P3 TaxID=3423952 RepID=UPI003D676136